MARPLEIKPWHTAAVQLRNQGLSISKIAETIGINVSTVKMYFSRSTPERQLDAVTKGPKIAPIAPPQVIQDSMMDLMVKVERSRAETLGSAMAAVQRYVTLGDDEAIDNKGAKAKAYLAVEAIKALRTGADISVNLGSLPGMKEANDQHTIQIEVVPASETH